jgi:hypothetical protein
MSLSDNFDGKVKKSLKVAFSKAADLPYLKSFYENNRHNTVHVRKNFVMQKAVDNGRFIVLKDESDQIRAGSGAYEFPDDRPTYVRPRWTEIGTTTANLPGYGLYPYIIASQVVMDFIKNTPSECFAATIDHDNTAVLEMLKNKVGWKEFTPDEDLIKGIKNTKDWSTTNPVVWLQARSESIPHQARLVLELIDKKELVNKKTGETMELDFSDFPLAGQLRAQVEALAHGKLARALEENPHITMSTARAYLAKHMMSQIHYPKP